MNSSDRRSVRYHVHLDAAGALINMTDKALAGLFQRVPAGEPLTAPEARLVPTEHLANGRHTVDAINSKIKRGDWLEGAVFIKAPDGRNLIDLEGYEEWVVQGRVASGQLHKAASK